MFHSSLEQSFGGGEEGQTYSPHESVSRKLTGIRFLAPTNNIVPFSWSETEAISFRG
jgi:hypothetical protein